MKTHSTDYKNTFIEIAEDCPTDKGQIPPIKSKKTIANIQYDVISKNPYKFTSDDVLFKVYAERNDLSKNQFESERKKLFSKGQACLRSSPLTKRYGWGIHFDENSKIAIYGVETNKYEKYANDKNLNTLKAMRSNKSNK